MAGVLFDKRIDINDVHRYLKHNLSLEINQSRGQYGENHVEVVLVLEGEAISSTFVS